MSTLSISKGQVNDIAVTVNQTDVNVQQANNITVEVTPQSRIDLTIDRGVKGDPGPNMIGGYGFNIADLQTNDVLMFGGTSWVNTNQTKITDGGNF